MVAGALVLVALALLLALASSPLDACVGGVGGGSCASLVALPAQLYI